MFDTSFVKASALTMLACLVTGSVAAQIGNPWNPDAAVPTVASPQYATPLLQIVVAQAAATSRYAPADLEQRLSAVKPTRPIAPPVMPQMQQPQMQAPNTGQQYQAPVTNGYSNNSYAPQSGYNAPRQGNGGFPPNYAPQGYNNYGNPMPYAPGRFPGGIGGFVPPGGPPGGGTTPFNFSPFGFF